MLDGINSVGGLGIAPEGSSGRVDRADRGKAAVERVFAGMGLLMAWQASDAALIAPLVRHACAHPVFDDDVDAIRKLLAGDGGSASFDAIVDETGSRVVARFAVLQLVGSGEVRVSPGYLSDRSVITLS